MYVVAGARRRKRQSGDPFGVSYEKIEKAEWLCQRIKSLPLFRLAIVADDLDPGLA
jgi:hypothetical protein